MEAGAEKTPQKAEPPCKNQGSSAPDAVSTAAANAKADSQAADGGDGKGTKRAGTSGQGGRGYHKRRRADFCMGDCGIFYTTGSPGATMSAKQDLVKLLDAVIEKKAASTKKASEGTVDQQLDEELKSLSEKPSAFVPSAHEIAKGTGFLKLNPEVVPCKPSELVEEMLERQRVDFLEKRLTMSSRFLCRILPIDHTCKPFPDDFKKLAEGVLKPVLGPDAEPTVWALEFKARNTSTLKKEAVLAIVDELVAKGRHKVSLNDPLKCILVEVNPLFCGLSIISSWSKLKKYNLYALTTPEEKKSEQAKPAAKPAGRDPAAAKSAEGAKDAATSIADGKVSNPPDAVATPVADSRDAAGDVVMAEPLKQDAAGAKEEEAASGTKEEVPRASDDSMRAEVEEAKKEPGHCQDVETTTPAEVQQAQPESAAG